MILKVSNCLAWIALIIVVLLKLKNLYGIVSGETLLTKMILWGVGTFILIKMVGRLADSALNLSEKKREVKLGESVDHTVEAAYPESKTKG